MTSDAMRMPVSPTVRQYTAGKTRLTLLRVIVTIAIGAQLLVAGAQTKPADDPFLQFDTATIKPVEPGPPRGTYFTTKGRHVIASNVTVEDLMKLAYGVHVKQIMNGPSWLTSDHFDIDGVPSTEEKPNHDQLRLLFRKLLVDRFHLVNHRENREFAVYALTLAKGGPKLAETEHKPSDPTNFSYVGSVTLTARNCSTADFADGLGATFLDRPVVDQTGLKGRYDFVLKWTPDDAPSGTEGSTPPNLYTAIREQLGLQLVTARAAANALIIDRLDRPSEN